MTLCVILSELRATLADCWQCADVPGHLRAWWELVRRPEPAEA